MTQSYIMHCVNAALFLIIFHLIHNSAHYDFVNLCPNLSYQYVCTTKLELPKLNFCDIVVLSTVSILIIYCLYISLLHCSYLVRYVKFLNNLSTLNKTSIVQNQISTNLGIPLLFSIAVFSISFESIVVLLSIIFEIGTFHIYSSLQICFKQLLTISCRWKGTNEMFVETRF